jgi:hypothetical protein
MSIRESLQPGSEQRSRLFHGTYGTGKSDLMLMLANYVTRDPDDALLQPFFERLRYLNSAQTEAIRQARQGKPPFLLVLLQADTTLTFSSFVLDGLVRALDKAQLPHLMGKTYYRAAIDLIHRWRNNRPENYQSLQQVLEREYATAPDSLERDLAGPRADYALDIFRLAVEKVTDIPFQPRDVIQRPADAFDEVANQLADMGKYSGVYIICDEFTHLMQRLAESPTGADSKAIDNLADRAVRSGSRQIHFSIVSLLPFTSAQGRTQLAQQSLERSGGRFIQRSLRSQDTEELIKHSIAKLVPTSEFFQRASVQQDDLLALAMMLWGKREERRRDREWIRETIIHGAFPLHPLATYCLPSLNRSLAQNERTMFSFLRDEEHGLVGFIQRSSADPSDAGWVPLMSLADLFEYFEPNLEEKRLDLILTYNQARMSLGDAQSASISQLADNILKALVLFEVVSDPNLQVDQTLLRHAVSLPKSAEKQLGDALEQLEQAYVVYKDHSEHYRLFLPGRVNPLELKRQIEQQAREMFGSPLDLLNSLHGQEAIKADSYNRERNTSRQVAARFIDLSGLSSPATLETELQGQDGLAWYVLVASEQELNAARAEALRITRENDRVVVAVPRQPTELIIRFQRKRALESLRANPNYQTTDAQDLLRDTGQIGKDYITSFEKARRAFENPHVLEWYYKGRTVDVHFSVDALATTMMKDVFPKTPPHQIAQHLKPNGTTKNVRDAVDSLLQAPFQLPPLEKGRKSPRDAILRDGAGVLGLISKVGKTNGYDKFDIEVPIKTSLLSQEIWKLIDDGLRKGDSWHSLVEKLKERPYGLYPSVLELFIAAFYRHNREYLEVCEANKIELRPIDLTGTVVEQLVQAPEKYVINYQPLSEMQRQYLHGLVERALYPGKPLGPQGASRIALRKRVAEALQMWGRQVPEMVRATTVADLASILTDKSGETLQAAVALIDTSQNADIPKIAAALLEELPGKLGLPLDGNSWTETQIEHAIALLEGACSVLQPQSFFQHLRDQIFMQVALLFGLEISTTNQDDILRVAWLWKNQLDGKIQASDLASRDARDLIYTLDNLDKSASLEQVFLEALPNRMGIQPYKDWKTVDVRDRYLQRLRAAKIYVEVAASKIVEYSQPSSPMPIPATPYQVTVPPVPTSRLQESGIGKDAPHISTASNLVAPSVPSIVASAVSFQPEKDNSDPGAAASISVPSKSESSVTEERPPIQLDTQGTSTNSQSEEESQRIEQAFAEVQQIFSLLTAMERSTLLKLLQREYGLP